MARPAKPIVPSKSSRTGDNKQLSHERIAEDLAAFRKAGGRIEVLGNTQVLKKVNPEG